jgi:hypothetical protein
MREHCVTGDFSPQLKHVFCRPSHKNVAVREIESEGQARRKSQWRNLRF